jgi:hypothetical protein
MPKKVTIESLPKEQRPTELLPLSKQLSDTIKMIAYRPGRNSNGGDAAPYGDVFAALLHVSFERQAANCARWPSMRWRCDSLMSDSLSLIATRMANPTRLRKGGGHRAITQKSQQTGEKLSKATLHAALANVKAFFHWLAGQPGHKSRLQYSDAD